MFRSTTLITLLALAVSVTATLDPATSNTKGKCPANPGCSPAKTSNAIQAAECSHNTRVSGTQTFAIFKTDHQYDSSHGAPYGTCEAYTCTPPSNEALTADEDCWTFYWGDEGEEQGEGAGCIKSPVDGTCMHLRGMGTDTMLEYALLKADYDFVFAQVGNKTKTPSLQTELSKLLSAHNSASGDPLSAI
ncbi:hypothetical protein DL768_008847 [Monosporascus sp. mg162]|nr:hypothetical protein DL768_008847 [Monosporascus sp. mg162]